MGELEEQGEGLKELLREAVAHAVREAAVLGEGEPEALEQAEGDGERLALAQAEGLAVPVPAAALPLTVSDCVGLPLLLCEGLEVVEREAEAQEVTDGE